MKYILKICMILIYLTLGVDALVTMVFIGKGKNGCLGPHGQMAVGEEVQDEMTCGVLVCADTDGNGFYQFCQKPAPFAKCANPNLINTKGKFPDCCWECVVAIDCKKRKSNPK